MDKELTNRVNESVIVIAVEKPLEPVENKVIACSCGGTLAYGSFPLKTKWCGMQIEVPRAYGWKCSSCDVTLLHSFVGDQLYEKMVQASTTRTP